MEVYGNHPDSQKSDPIQIRNNPKASSEMGSITLPKTKYTKLMKEGLSRWSSNFFKKDDYNQKLVKILNKNNYEYKVKKLLEKLNNEVSLWERKGKSARLDDLKRDLNFVQSQIETKQYDKTKLDQLGNKYAI